MSADSAQPKRRGRTLAWLLGLAAITAVGAGVLLLRDRILEEWYFLQLDSSETETREEAVEKLIHLGSPRGILAFLEHLGSEERPRWEDRAEAAMQNLSRAWAARLAVEALHGERSRLQDLLELVEGMKDRPAPLAGFFAVLLENRDADLRRIAAELLGRSCRDAMDAIPALTAALDDVDRDVRFWATVSLAQIDPDGVGGAQAVHHALLSGDPVLLELAELLKVKEK